MGGSSQVRVPESVPLRSGASVEIDRVRERLTLRGSGGEVQLRIRVTADGLVLSISSCQLEIEQTETLRVCVDRLEIETQRGINLRSKGSIEQRVAGDITMHCEGTLQVQSGAVAVVAHTGDLSLESTHDVAIEGERLLLNCDY
jgi:hypothetical protein